MKQTTLLPFLLSLCDKPYDEYNAVLSEIMTKLPLDVQVSTFQQVLSEELPLTTMRRAFRTAIKVAMGEENVYREYQLRSARPHKKNIKKETK